MNTAEPQKGFVAGEKEFFGADDLTEPGMTEAIQEQPSQLRVLLAEDDSDTADRLALLLRLWGHNIKVCQNGNEVLESVAAYQPHVVLLDIGLPGMEGSQETRRLREQLDLQKIMLISITGFGDEAHRHRAEEEGFDDNLIKAVDPHQLKELLLKVVSDSRFVQCLPTDKTPD